MSVKKTRLLPLLLPMVLGGCGSQAPAHKPPPPAAWAMIEPSNSLKVLDETFTLSEPESSKTAIK